MPSWIKALPLGLVLPLVIGSASVAPDVAASNISQWAELLGVRGVPPWLADKAADHWVIGISLAFAGLYSFAVWGVPLLRRRRGKPPPPKIDYPFEIGSGAFRMVRNKFAAPPTAPLLKMEGGRAEWVDNTFHAPTDGFLRPPLPIEAVTASASPEDLGRKVAAVSGRLRSLQAAVDDCDKALMSKGEPDVAYRQRRNRLDFEFDNSLRGPSLALLTELLHETGPIERLPLPPQFLSGYDAAMSGGLAGYSPASGLARLLEWLERKTQDKWLPPPD